MRAATRPTRTGGFGAWLEPRPREGVQCVELRLNPPFSTQYTTVTGPCEDEEDEATTKALHQAHRFVRGVAGATPQGARCVELRLKPQLKASLVLAAPVSDSCAHMRGESGRGRGSRFGRRSRCLPRCLRCLDLLCIPFVHQLLVLHFSRFPLRQLHLEVCLAHRVLSAGFWLLHALGWPRLQGKLGLGRRARQPRRSAQRHS